MTAMYDKHQPKIGNGPNGKLGMFNNMLIQLELSYHHPGWHHLVHHHHISSKIEIV